MNSPKIGLRLVTWLVLVAFLGMVLVPRAAVAEPIPTIPPASQKGQPLTASECADFQARQADHAALPQITASGDDAMAWILAIGIVLLCFPIIKALSDSWDVDGNPDNDI